MAKRKTFKEELNELIVKHENSNNRGDVVRSKFIKGAMANYERSLKLMADTSKKDLLPAKKEIKVSQIDQDLAYRLYDWMVKNSPKTKEPNWDKWGDEFRRIREIDGHEKIQIERVIDWCQKDHFWCANILSPFKLRKQFSSLLLRINKGEQPVIKQKKPGLMSGLSNDLKQ